MDEETTAVNPTRFNVWVALYIAMALFWVFMAYTEISGRDPGSFLPGIPNEQPVIEGSVTT